MRCVFAVSLLSYYVLVQSSNAQYIESPATEAEQIALEVSGELLPPEMLVEEILTDLSTIRSVYSGMSEVQHQPLWVAGEVLISLSASAQETHEQGEFSELEELNDSLGLVGSSAYSGGDPLILTFGLPYHPDRLVELYTAIEGIEYGEPRYRIGEGATIVANPPLYTFKTGWEDCPSGCIYGHTWIFSVTDDVATLIDEFGDPTDFDIYGIRAEGEGVSEGEGEGDGEGEGAGNTSEGEGDGTTIFLQCAAGSQDYTTPHGDVLLLLLMYLVLSKGRNLARERSVNLPITTEDSR